MEDPPRHSTENPVLSPSSSGRRSTGDTSSPEFEFWMIRNPSLPPPNLLTADELFSDGVILPLHNLFIREPSTELPSPAINLPVAESTPASRRWTNIFKKSEKKVTEKKKKEKTVKGQTQPSSAELNINIWPFSRSRSAGDGGSRIKTTPSRKVSSAPCSRSNSSGESKSRKWPSSPGRSGVHVGRTSPVWHVKRGNRNSEQPAVAKKEHGEARRSKVIGGGAGGRGKPKGLNLNVPMCIGYKQQLSCRRVESGPTGNHTVVGGGDGSNGGGGGNLFNLRGLLNKKVY